MYYALPARTLPSFAGMSRSLIKASLSLCIGWLQVLFFSTILANLVGRTLPKWKAFAITTPTLLMYLSFFKLAVAPLCFVYLKSPDRWHSDIAAAGKPQLYYVHQVAV